MKETLGASLLIAYGLLIGMLVGSQLGIDAERWTPLAAGIRDLATAVGICVGGAWAYAKFVRSRESEARINLTHEVTSVELESVLFLRVILEIKNIGPVAVLPPSGFMLVQLPPKHPGSVNEDPQKVWSTQHRIEYAFLGDHLCIEPGDTVRYSRDVTLDSSARYVQLYSSVLLGVGKWRVDETSVHKLKPVPAVENPAQQ